MRIYFDKEVNISPDVDEGRLVLALLRREGPGPDETSQRWPRRKPQVIIVLLRLEGTEIRELPPTSQDGELQFYDLTGLDSQENWTCFADTWAFDQGPRTYIIQVAYAMDFDTPPNLLLIYYAHNELGDRTEAEWREELIREDMVLENNPLFRLDLRPWVASQGGQARTWHERLT